MIQMRVTVKRDGFRYHPALPSYHLIAIVGWTAAPQAN